jgi:hypothetical protein
MGEMQNFATECGSGNNHYNQEGVSIKVLFQLSIPFTER